MGKGCRLLQKSMDETIQAKRRSGRFPSVLKRAIARSLAALPCGRRPCSRTSRKRREEAHRASPLAPVGERGAALRLSPRPCRARSQGGGAARERAALACERAEQLLLRRGDPPPRRRCLAAEGLSQGGGGFRAVDAALFQSVHQLRRACRFR